MAAAATQPVLEVPVVESAPARWPWPLGILFRFSFSYFPLYTLPESGRVSIFAAIPGVSNVTTEYTNLWHALVPWVAIKVFHLSGQAVTYIPTGSGDTTLDYIENLCYIVLALAATLVWSVL